MTVWIFILIAVLTVFALGVIYMTAAIGRFGGIQRLSGDKRWLRRLISFGILAVILTIVCFIFNVVNTVIIFIHVLAFFLIAGGVIRLIKRAGKEFKINWQGWGAILVSIVYLSVGYYLCNNVWQTDYAFTTDKNIGSLKMAVLSDSHIGATFDGDGFAAHLLTIMQQNPDILLIPGDFVDDDTSREDMIRSCKALGEIHPKYGVWYSYGNHDKGYYDSSLRGYSGEDLENELKKNGVHVMLDDVEIFDNICIVGRKDSSTMRDRKDLSELLKGVDESNYIIVMDHEPNDYEKESQTPADLVLCGHTHGGQFFPVTYFGVWFGINDAVYGHEQRNGTDFIVTSGISDWALKFKTGTKSEYLIINISETSK